MKQFVMTLHRKAGLQIYTSYMFAQEILQPACSCVIQFLKTILRTEQLTKCCEALQKMRVRLCACKAGLSPPNFFVTDRSKAILLWWFILFYVLVFKVIAAHFSCSFGLRYVFMV